MSRVLQVAKREFVSTALTKGFIIGAFVVPALFAALIPAVVVLMLNTKAPPIVGEIAIIDKSEQVGGDFEERFFQTLENDRAEQQEMIDKATDMAGGLAGGAGGADGMAQGVVENLLADIQVSVRVLEPDADRDEATAPLMDASEKNDPSRLLAVAVIDSNAVIRATNDAGEEEFGAFELFVRPKTDDRTAGAIRATIRESIKDRRYEHYGFDRAEIDELGWVGGSTREITASGEERGSTENLQQMLPMVFMFLMLMSIMIGGTYLLTTTVEEKSSRVVELLLSATSPMQLMTGKILGQMAVGMSMMVIYSSVGIAALFTFALQDMIEVSSIVYMLVFFVLGYFMIASLMAAIGSAVNDMREAQALQTPVIITIMVPYMLWFPISRDPDSTLATVLSFTPPVSPFIMMMRVVSSDPPPTWEVLASIGVMCLGVLVCLKIAAKVFRIGLLMYGKPPNLRTLIKWVRMA
ncbi:MAG: ABC-2 type transport system permease protein [Phycisphaerales bacterium]|jgi:ABC-2 type transport system permease protein